MVGSFLGGFVPLAITGCFGGIIGYTFGRFRNVKKRKKNEALQRHYERMGLGR